MIPFDAPQFFALTNDTVPLAHAAIVLFCLTAVVLCLTVIKGAADRLPRFLPASPTLALGAAVIVSWWWASLIMTKGTATDAAHLTPVAMSVALGLVIVQITMCLHKQDRIIPDDGLILGAITLMPLTVQLLV